MIILCGSSHGIIIVCDVLIGSSRGMIIVCYVLIGSSHGIIIVCDALIGSSHRIIIVYDIFDLLMLCWRTAPENPVWARGKHLIIEDMMFCLKGWG